MSQIVVATDLSERAERAQRMASLIARQSGAALKLVYAIDAEQPATITEVQRNTATLMLQRLATTIETSDRLACSFEVASASGIEHAISAAVEADTELLVLGSHRQRQLRDLFLGGTSERIIAHVDCPVLVVRAAPLECYRKLLFATDLSEASLETARRLRGLSLTAPLSVTLAHLVGTQDQAPVAYNQMSDTASEAVLANAQSVAAERLQRFVERAGLDAVTQRVEADRRPTAAALMDLAAREGADLIGLSPRQSEGLAGFLRYRLTTRLLNASPVDLLLF